MAFNSKRTLLASLLSFSFAVTAADPLQPEPEHRVLLLEVLNKLTSSHYQKRPIDDAFSAELYESYIDQLDHSKSYFLESDVKALEHWRLELDDAMAKGKLEFPFEVFTRYRDLRAEQLDRNIRLLESDFTFDLTDQEFLSQDWDQRSRPKTAEERDEWSRKIMEFELLRSVLNSVSVTESESSEGALDGEEIKTPELTTGTLDQKTIDKKALTKAREVLTKRYKRDVKELLELESRDVFSNYAGVITTLFDPHTNYFSPSVSDSFNINMALSLEGIGAVLKRSDEGYIEVTSLVPGGPSAMQGELQAGDKIIAITNDGDKEATDLVGWRLDDAVSVIRGPKDSIARLQVIQAKTGSDAIKVINITRDKVKLEEQAAKKELVNVGTGAEQLQVGIITIPTFYRDFAAAARRDRNYKSTTRDVLRLMGELITDQGADGIVLDLRSNGGGSLEESSQLSDLFLNPGPVVQIRTGTGQIDRSQQARQKAAYSGPLVVVIDRLSASASEIFAGAIQDYGRGVIVGSQSYGKGTVQTLLPLGKGQLKLTGAKFYRVSGDSTQNRGVIPDISFPARFDPETFGESSQDNALPWDTIKPARYRPFADLSDGIALLQKAHDQRATSDPDFSYVKELTELNNRFAKENKLPTSLNFKERQELMQERKQQQLNIENKRRLAKGLEAYADTQARNNAIKDIDSDTLPLQEKDPLLMEASRIVADMIKLSKNSKRVAK